MGTASPLSSLTSGRISTVVSNNDLRIGLEILIVVGNHRHITPRLPADQSEEHCFCNAVHHVSNEGGEVELLSQNNYSNHDNSYDERSEYFADFPVSNSWHCGIRDIADHQERQSEHQKAKPEVPWQVAEDRLVIERALAEPVVRRERHSGSRTRKAVEVSLCPACLLDVEPREPDCSARHVKECDQPFPSFLVEHREVHDERRREPERHDVYEGVELGAEA